MRVFSPLISFKAHIVGRVGLVVGSRLPWVECFALTLGAARVVTLEYGKVRAADPRITTMTPDQVNGKAKKYWEGGRLSVNHVYFKR